MKRNEWKRNLREQAEARKVERDKLTDQQQIDKLNKKFGFGQGAQKERKRLQERIEAKKVSQVENETKDAQNAAQTARKNAARKHNLEIHEAIPEGPH